MCCCCCCWYLLQITDLPARELVPGDVVELHVGDRVPADMRLVQLRTATLRAEQASLTGEPVAVLKTTDVVPDADCELQVCVAGISCGAIALPSPATGLVACCTAWQDLFCTLHIFQICVFEHPACGSCCFFFSNLLLHC